MQNMGNLFTCFSVQVTRIFIKDVETCTWYVILELEEKGHYDLFEHLGCECCKFFEEFFLYKRHHL